MKTWAIWIVTGLMAVTSARAEIYLYASEADHAVGEPEANPCFYGGSNCHNGTWNMLAAPTGNSNDTFTGTITYDLTLSPYNTVLVPGSAFLIGVDFDDTGSPQVINSLTVDFGLGTLYRLRPPDASLPNVNNGAGWSDYFIQLESGNPIPIPSNATQVTFSVSLSNLNDGPDRLFVSRVPDGGLTLMLLGGALVVLETVRRKLTV